MWELFLNIFKIFIMKLLSRIKVPSPIIDSSEYSKL